MLVQDFLQVAVDGLAVREDCVQFNLAQHGAQGGLGELAGGVEEVLHLDDGLHGLDHAEVVHRVDLDGDVVLGDHVLRRNVHHHRAQGDPRHLVHQRDEQEHARPLGADGPAQAEDHAALELGQNANGGEQQPQQDDDADSDFNEHAGSP